MYSESEGNYVEYLQMYVPNTHNIDFVRKHIEAREHQF